MRLRIKIGLMLLLAWLLVAGIASLLPAWSQTTTYQLKLYPINDATTSNSYPDENYGDAAYLNLWVGYTRLYIKFNFTATGITSPLPDLKYYLRLFRISGGTEKSGASIYVYATTNDWDESTLTWNNQPASNSTTPIASVSQPSVDHWIVLNITSYVINNCMNKVCSFIVTYEPITSSNQDYYIKVASKEYSVEEIRPHVLIEYSPETTTTTETVTITETITEYVTETTTITTTQTDYVTETQTTTTTVTDTIYTTETAYTTQTVTTTQTITDVITETATTTITQTETIWANETVTVTTTITPTATETVEGNATLVEQSVDYQALADMLMPIVLIVGVIGTLLGLLLQSTSFRRGD